MSVVYATEAHADVPGETGARTRAQVNDDPARMDQLLAMQRALLVV